jgi:hypothetical protein
MSKCNTCEYSGGCKEEAAHQRFEQVVGSDCNCSGFKQEEDKTGLYEDIKEGLRQALAYEKNTLVEVVRCKDCRHCFHHIRPNYERYECEYKGCSGEVVDYVEPMHYCSYGEKKTD